MRGRCAAVDEGASVQTDRHEDERYAEYEHWLVLNPADQIVEVGQLLRQQVRTLEYAAPDAVGRVEEPVSR
jgi:hypothetical protein